VVSFSIELNTTFAILSTGGEVIAPRSLHTPGRVLKKLPLAPDPALPTTERALFRLSTLMVGRVGGRGRRWIVLRERLPRFFLGSTPRFTHKRGREECLGSSPLNCRGHGGRSSYLGRVVMTRGTLYLCGEGRGRRGQIQFDDDNRRWSFSGTTYCQYILRPT